MDPVSIAFYALVCGCLSAAAPRLGSMATRLASGAVVGIVAATVLPIIKTAMGLGY